ncbi:MAG: phosphoglycolate phosphatase [Paracoccaceae bacterium]
MTARAAIVFDLDGTLVDSVPDLHVAANAMLAEAGLAPLDLATVTSFVGHGIPNLVRRVMAARGIAPDREAAMQSVMLRHYLAHPADLTRPYPAVPQVLQDLREQGFALGVCTNKLREPAMAILDALDLTRHFGVVIGGDSTPQRKPDPAPLFAAYAALGGAPLLYVGDSEVDAETAQAAGIAFALFTRGYRTTPVDQLPHRISFDDFAMLPGHVAALSG